MIITINNSPYIVLRKCFIKHKYGVMHGCYNVELYEIIYNGTKKIFQKRVLDERAKQEFFSRINFVYQENPMKFLDSYLYEHLSLEEVLNSIKNELELMEHFNIEEIEEC